MKLTAKERRAGLDLRDVLGHRKTTGRKKKPAAKAAEFRPIEYTETTLHDTSRVALDETGGVRLYCTAGAYTHGEENARWALQVRAQVRTKTRGVGKHFAVGTASMSRDDLQWLRDQIDAELRRKS
jgi:alpha-D-ribose 1-methylphosphonate 5-triphosphate synthase subunit PhnG